MGGCACEIEMRTDRVDSEDITQAKHVKCALCRAAPKLLAYAQMVDMRSHEGMQPDSPARTKALRLLAEEHGYTGSRGVSGNEFTTWLADFRRRAILEATEITGNNDEV